MFPIKLKFFKWPSKSVSWLKSHLLHSLLRSKCSDGTIFYRKDVIFIMLYAQNDLHDFLLACIPSKEASIVKGMICSLGSKSFPLKIHGNVTKKTW